MWSSPCQHDLPLKPLNEPRSGCAPCGALLEPGKSSDPDRVPADAFVEVTPSDPPPACEDWSVDFDLSEIELALKSSRLTTGRWARTDPPHELGRSIGQPRIPSTPRETEQASDPQPRPGIWAWSLLLLGVMGLACGAVLVGCSYLPGRHDLWAMGLPVLLAGQAVLLVGLVLQIERVWRNSRAYSRQLQRVDQEVSQLNRSAALWATTASPPATAFYQHLAHGASSQVLLADLKGQIDLLATRTG
jgi:hypothetical protein